LKLKINTKQESSKDLTPFPSNGSKKKIGILTFAWSVNYGAKLQALALQSVVSSLGFECEVISYKRAGDRWIRETVNLLKSADVKRAVRGLLTETLNWRRSWRFRNFTSQHIRLSPETCFDADDLSLLSERYDAIICGSDQVWNPDLAREALPAYLLDFPEKRKFQRIAYAPSIGNEALEEKWHDTFTRCLGKFDSLSVREKSAAPFLQSLAKKEVTTVLDPTLLLPQEKWVPYQRDVNTMGKFLLIYSFGISSGLQKVAEYIAKNRGLKIVTFHKRRHYPNELNRYPYAGPGEFLGLFAEADFIITNSFHGTVFSIIFKKPFLSITDKRGCRLKDLLTGLGLEKRIILNDGIQAPVRNSDINYTEVDQKLSLLREHSSKFLTNALR